MSKCARFHARALCKRLKGLFSKGSSKVMQRSLIKKEMKMKIVSHRPHFPHIRVKTCLLPDFHMDASNTLIILTAFVGTLRCPTEGHTEVPEVGGPPIWLFCIKSKHLCEAYRGWTNWELNWQLCGPQLVYQPPTPSILSNFLVFWWWKHHPLIHISVWKTHSRG